MNWNYHKIIKGILKHDITYVKKFYHKYKKIIKRGLKEESNKISDEVYCRYYIKSFEETFLIIIIPRISQNMTFFN